MAVTTTYTWEDGINVFLNNAFTAGSQNQPAIIANFSGDRYFGAWSDPAFANQVEGRVVAADQTNIVDEFTVNNPATNAGFSQFDPSIAGLTGGNFVVTYHDRAADPGGDIRARLYSPSGTPLGADFAIDAGANDDTTATVSELFGGGFVVTYERDFGGGDIDIRARVFNSAGTDLSGLIAVESGAGAQTAPWVAGLNFGGFVVVWQDAVDGGVWMRRYDNNGTALAGEQLIDSFGANTDIHVQALNDGGFAVAYTDTGWGTGQDITFQIFNANGTARTGFIKANSAAAPGGLDAGNQNLPTITTMGDIIVVGWVDPASATSFAQAFDAAGNRLGAIDAVNSSVVEQEIAGLSGGRLAVVRRSSVEEGAGLGDSIRTTVNTFERVFNSDGAGDTIVGVNDGLREIFNGNGGADTFNGGTGTNIFNGGAGSDTVTYTSATAGVTASLFNPASNTGVAANDTYNSIENLTGSAFNDNLTGDANPNALSGLAGNDRLTGRGGNDAMDGGAGFDIAFFSGLRSAYQTYILADGVHVIGPDGSDLLNGIETLVFEDTAIAAPQPTHYTASQSLGSHPAGWTPAAGVFDFTGDGTADIGWFNPTNGNIDIWAVSGGNYAGSVGPGNHPLGWSPVTSGDFDNNGSNDIAWYNPTSGNLEIWRLNGGNWIGSNDLGNHPAGWIPKGAGDFNADGTDDVLWYNPTTGNAEFWFVSGGNWAGSQNVGDHAAGWSAAGVGDFDGDGTDDILWHNPTTNNAEVWKIVGGTFSSAISLGNHAAGSVVGGIADFNGDGTDDILWHNPTTGLVDIWRISGNALDAQIDIGPHPLGWDIAGVGDLTNDGRADVVWHEAASGKIDNWILGN